MQITRLGPADVYALTGMTPTNIDHIAAATRHRAARRGRPPRFTHRNRVLLVLVALRTNLTERALAAIFGVSQPTAHRAIRDLMTLRQCRRRGNAINLAIKCVAFLWNLKLAHL